MICVCLWYRTFRPFHLILTLFAILFDTTRTWTYQHHAYEYEYLNEEEDSEEQVYGYGYDGAEQEQVSGDDFEKKHERGGALLVNTKKEKMKYMYDQKQKVPMDEREKGGEEDEEEIDKRGGSVHVSCLAWWCVCVWYRTFRPDIIHSSRSHFICNNIRHSYVNI